MVLVGIAGGSGSGKSTLAEGVVRALPAGRAVVIAHDAYYRDLGHLPPAERARHNFDEPAALETERLCEDLRRLRGGQPIPRPAYDFAAHTRRPTPVQVPAAPVVIIEGILVLAIPELRAMLDLKVFVTASANIRLERRIARDVGERGRTRESVVEQFVAITQPMHQRHVAPSEARADVVVSGEGELSLTVHEVVGNIQQLSRPEKRA